MKLKSCAYNNLFFFKKTRFLSDSLFRFPVESPADEKIRSTGADVAGIARMSIAIVLIRGYSWVCLES